MRDGGALLRAAGCAVLIVSRREHGPGKMSSKTKRMGENNLAAQRGPSRGGSEQVAKEEKTAVDGAKDHRFGPRSTRAGALPANGLGWREGRNKKRVREGKVAGVPPGASERGLSTRRAGTVRRVESKGAKGEDLHRFKRA